MGCMYIIRKVSKLHGDTVALYTRNSKRNIKNGHLTAHGVYFDVRVEHIKFVDFCGKYRIPLLQYLCSPRCSTTPAIGCLSQSDTTSSDDDSDIPESRLRRVLLG